MFGPDLIKTRVEPGRANNLLALSLIPALIKQTRAAAVLETCQIRLDASLNILSGIRDKCSGINAPG